MTQRKARRIGLGELAAELRSLKVHLHHIVPTVESFEIWFFLNLDSAEVDTATMEHDLFIDIVTMYGVGDIPPGEAPPQVGPLEVTIEIAESVLDRARRQGNNELVLLAFDLDGSSLDPRAVRFESLAVEPTAPIQ